jgi:hypothetical protein
MNRQNFSHFPFSHLLLLQRSLAVRSGLSPSRSRLLTRSYSPFTLHPCRWTNHPHRVLNRSIETKVPPGTPDAVMAQTGTGGRSIHRLPWDTIYDCVCYASLSMFSVTALDDKMLYRTRLLTIRTSKASKVVKEIKKWKK